MLLLVKTFSLLLTLFLISTLALVLFCGAFVATCTTASYACATAAGYFIFVCMGVGHNFFHQADNPKLHRAK